MTAPAGTTRTGGDAPDGGPTGPDGRPVHPVDERLPLLRLLPLAAQHVLAMLAAPVSTAFLIATGLGLPPDRTAALLSATLVLCGAGALLQSFGVLRIGARLPFMMLPGGAAVAIFLQIADEHGPATASGAVLISATFLLAVLPLYRHIVRFFPPVVLGTTVLLIGINMVNVTAPMIAHDTWLALVTIGATALCYLVLPGVWRQMSVLAGIAAGTTAALISSTGMQTVPAGGPFLALPHPFPYGAPHFDLLAAIPLIVFTLASLAEATGQTVLNSEAVGREPHPARDVPRTVRADALTSLAAGLLGTSIMVTSAENIGIVQLTRVRSRFVTAGAGLLLVLIGLLAPVSRLLATLPTPVVGGAGLIIYAVIAAMGIGMLRRTESFEGPTTTIVALTLLAGLLPVLTPELYEPLPVWARTVFGSGVPAGAITAVLLTALFTRDRR
ncbi:uracil-xanthine permease family protein [Streptomyces sclerotialus]|uniref:uracil-xanthine permease family protein n=1 Tax=Streptomyces sclerotialus TaxID=1957 RepID=UPI000A8D8612